jgi:hypothetical protein
VCAEILSFLIIRNMVHIITNVFWNKIFAHISLRYHEYSATGIFISLRSSNTSLKFLVNLKKTLYINKNTHMHKTCVRSYILVVDLSPNSNGYDCHSNSSLLLSMIIQRTYVETAICGQRKSSSHL